MAKLFNRRLKHKSDNASECIIVEPLYEDIAIKFFAKSGRDGKFLLGISLTRFEAIKMMKDMTSILYAQEKYNA